MQAGARFFHQTVVLPARQHPRARTTGPAFQAPLWRLAPPLAVPEGALGSLQGALGALLGVLGALCHSSERF